MSLAALGLAARALDSVSRERNVNPSLVREVDVVGGGVGYGAYVWALGVVTADLREAVGA